MLSFHCRFKCARQDMYGETVREYPHCGLVISYFHILIVIY